MWQRKLRLGSGLVVTLYVVMHLLNHALGLISFELMDQARQWMLVLWGNPLALALLYVSLGAHLGLTLSVLYRRTTLRMPLWEAAQLTLGLLVIPLIALHATGTRGTRELLGIDIGYEFVLAAIWSSDLNIFRHLLLTIVVWLHVAIGLHFWLRLRAWYPKSVPVLYALAIVLPLLALLSFAEWGAHIRTMLLEEDMGDVFFADWAAADPVMRALVVSLDERVIIGFVVLLAAVLIARQIRVFFAARGKSYRLKHDNGRELVVPMGFSVLEAVRTADIPHASVCGGRGRCTTCRVRVGLGLQDLPEPSELESTALQRINADPNVRLACQMYPTTDLSISPMIPAKVSPSVTHQPGGVSGREQTIVVMFIDLRGSTKLGEERLPYDVVFILNQFFSEMWAALERTDGHYAQFSGDGLMALYGLDTDLGTGARAAFRGAIEMSERMANLNTRLEGELAEPLRIGIGIHCGDAIVGTMGPPRSPNLSAVGDNVNVAARLEAQTKNLNCTLVVSVDAARAAGLDLSAHPTHLAELRGRGETVEVFAIEEPSSIAGLA